MFTFILITTFAHIALGTLAVAMGGIALAASKGRKVHVLSGRVFVFGMAVSSLIGAALGALKYETLLITFFAGILGATLVISGVLAVRIAAPRSKRWFIAVGGVNALNAAGLLAAGVYASTMLDGVLLGFAASDYFFLFGMAAIAFVGDLKLLFAKSISKRHRVAQHLLRMCIGFFIAAGSAFTGPGASAFPQSVQNSGVLSLPELMIALLMLFWLWKTMRSQARNDSNQSYFRQSQSELR